MRSQIRFLILVLAAVFWTGFAGAQVAASYQVIDHTSGHVLEAYKSDQKRPVASLTKIATAKVVLDWATKNGIDLSQAISVPPLINTGGVNPMGLQTDDLVSYRTLIYAALLQSDNTAASTLAYHVGSALRSRGATAADLTPIDTFVSQMNALARQLGMEKTLFVNPHGLEPQRGLQPFSTAADMAKLAAYAMKDAAFRFYVSQKERRVAYQRAGNNLEFLLRNTNELVGTLGIDGVKTGRTSKAGDCIIISSQHEPEIRKEGETTYVTPRRIDVVVLGAAERFSAARSLVSQGWGLYEQWAAAGRPSAQASDRR